jgi:deoxyribodipyrimidine photo-lyase
VVADDFPAFFLPRMVAAAAGQTSIRFEAVDSNGILPLVAAGGRVFQTAFSFRRFLQKELPGHFLQFPKENPFEAGHLPTLRALPEDITIRWPPARKKDLDTSSHALSTFPVDHSVPRVSARGGAGEARENLDLFIREKLPRYLEDRNHPDAEATSGLSPYLHFGHISSHEILSRIAGEEKRPLPLFSGKASGGRAGWWKMSEGAEAFLDQLVTWRELGFNMCAGRGDYDRYDSLPEWARKTLADHASDRRPQIYSIERLRDAKTYDPVWNAAQRELMREGRIHNYLRMLWGKKILEWTPDPAAALDIMIELNNRYALDGRDPNSYSGIFWVLGRYDRPWGPERPVFGKIRYMKSENTARKVRLKDYLERYKEAPGR